MQNKAKQFNENMPCHRKPAPTFARLLDIQSELGELSKEYLKATRYGTEDFSVTEDFKMEFGDVLYSLLALANELNISAELSLNMALKNTPRELTAKITWEAEDKDIKKISFCLKNLVDRRRIAALLTYRQKLNNAYI